MEYKLYRTTFKSRARNILNKTSLMVLEYEGTYIYIWNNYEISRTFRTILKAIYPRLDFPDIPKDDFFKQYLTDIYFKKCEITKTIAEKKQGYFKQKKKESILKQIDKLNNKLKELL